MKPFAEVVQEQRRLSILRLLESVPMYASTEVLLYQALPDQGVASSIDQVRGDLAWLGEQGLVTVEHIGDVMTGRITGRGIDVAIGRALVPGVARPRPGA